MLKGTEPRHQSLHYWTSVLREKHLYSKKVGVRVNRVEPCEVNLSIHMDKKPIVLVYTMSTTGPGPTRRRTERKVVKGHQVYKEWTLKQPVVHSIYRAKFDQVDRFNAYEMGLRSIQKAQRTRDWWMRFWYAMLGACVTNAYLAYSFTNRNQDSILTQTQFKKELVAALIANPWS